jgi:hypothetical protein
VPGNGGKSKMKKQTHFGVIARTACHSSHAGRRSDPPRANKKLDTMFLFHGCFAVYVIPAQAGIHLLWFYPWTPAFAGVTGWLGQINQVAVWPRSLIAAYSQLGNPPAAASCGVIQNEKANPFRCNRIGAPPKVGAAYSGADGPVAHPAKGRRVAAFTRGPSIRCQHITFSQTTPQCDCRISPQFASSFRKVGRAAGGNQQAALWAADVHICPIVSPGSGRRPAERTAQ